MSWIKTSLGFNDKWLVIIGVPVIAFVMSNLLYSSVFVEDTLSFFLVCFPVGIYYTGLLWLSFRWVLSFLFKKFPRTEDTMKRLSIQIPLILVGYFLLKAILDFFLAFIIDNPSAPNFMIDIVAGLLFTFLIVAIYEGVVFYTKLQKSLQEKEQLQRENIQSQLEGLRNQVNPHFLFNSLNTLIYLIPEDPQKAVNFVQKLSKVYRYILEIRDRKLIPLSEELEFLHAYIFLLKERFGENIQSNCEVPIEFLDKKIVPLSLQILFENAIKHNIISAKKPLTISVVVEKDKDLNNKLIVKNNLQKKSQIEPSTHTGLQNIKNRYRFFTDQKVDVVVTANSFLVALPLLDSIKNEKLLQPNGKEITTTQTANL